MKTKKRWIPKVGEEYWCIDILTSMYVAKLEHRITVDRYTSSELFPAPKNGVWKTRKEAMAARKKIINILKGEK